MEQQANKQDVLITASQNLGPSEQCLILLAMVEARQSGKGMKVDDPLEIHVDRYSHQFGVDRNTACEAFKHASKYLFPQLLDFQLVDEQGNIEKGLSRWVSHILYVDDKETFYLSFALAIVPLISKIDEQLLECELQLVTNQKC